MTNSNSNLSGRESEISTPSYETLAALRNAHVTLKLSEGRPTEASAQGSARERIMEFLLRAKGTGGFLSNPKERRAAQSILDYWSAALASMSDAKPDDYATILLEP